MNPRRIKKAIADGYMQARAALADAHAAKSAGYTIGVRAALETIAQVRRHNARRRLALRLGRPV